MHEFLNPANVLKRGITRNYANLRGTDLTKEMTIGVNDVAYQTQLASAGGINRRQRIPDNEIPAHGTLARNRQQIPADKAVGAVPPDDVTTAPAWIEVAPS